MGLSPNPERQELRFHITQIRRELYILSHNVKALRTSGREPGAKLLGRIRELRARTQSLSRRLRYEPPVINKSGGGYWPKGHFKRFRNSRLIKRWRKVEFHWLRIRTTQEILKEYVEK